MATDNGRWAREIERTRKELEKDDAFSECNVKGLRGFCLLMVDDMADRRENGSAGTTLRLGKFSITTDNAVALYRAIGIAAIAWIILTQQGVLPKIDITRAEKAAASVEVAACVSDG